MREPNHRVACPECGYEFNTTWSPKDWAAMWENAPAGVHSHCEHRTKRGEWCWRFVRPGQKRCWQHTPIIGC